MKYIPTQIIAAVVLLGCRDSQKSASTPEAKPVEPAPTETPSANAPKAKPESPAITTPGISILKAAKNGNIEVVKQHIAAGTDVNVNEKSFRLRSPLHYASETGHREIVELLIAGGANVNAKRSEGVTPLHDASGRGHREIVELLIAGGANVNIVVAGWGTPLHQASGNHGPSGGGHKEIIELLIANGADVNAQDSSAFGGVDSPLHQAKNKEIGELLISKGAKVNAIAGGDHGKTPLHAKVRSGDKEFVELLITKGADVNAKDGGGYPPLYLAAERGRKEIIALLIAGGADVNARSGEFKLTALDGASATDRAEIADLLRKHGGNTGEELKAEGK